MTDSVLSKGHKTLLKIIKQGKKMRSLLFLLLGIALPFTASADDHLPQPNITAIWECTLTEGTTAADLAEWGAGDLKKWIDKNDINIGSYLWEAVATNPPFDEPDVRWVDYHSSWADFYAMKDAWDNKSGALQDKWDSMVTCGKTRFAVARPMGGPVPQATEKPLVANVCTLNEGKTLQDAMAFLPKATSLINETVGAEISSLIFTNFIGVSGPDYVSLYTGTTSEMVKAMDGLKNGAYASVFTRAGLEIPSSCVVDLHHSYEMIPFAN